MQSEAAKIEKFIDKCYNRNIDETETNWFNDKNHSYAVIQMSIST